jgi:hypothetical protein
MIRKLLLPALLVGLLGGCVTAGYGYRDGYYYGQPSVEYRYHDYGYYPYGYGYYPYGGYGYYSYNYPYYNPYYGRYPYYYRHRQPRPPVTGTPPPGPQPDDNDDHNPPPWRDLSRRRQVRDVSGRELPSQDRLLPRAQPQVITRESPRRESSGEGSRMRQVIQRAQETRRRSSGEKQEP